MIGYENTVVNLSNPHCRVGRRNTGIATRKGTQSQATPVDND